jgi:2-polyprenyl-6-methoxyphenol hydroxylase-like FAD-dependent oxidoreductase
MRILISGDSVAGPVLAYWLTRHGFSTTVVEHASALRKTGGHAVDLFRPAMNISEKMGLLPRVEDRATGTNRMTFHREGARRPVQVNLSKIFSATRVKSDAAATGENDGKGRTVADVDRTDTRMRPARLGGSSQLWARRAVGSARDKALRPVRGTQDRPPGADH